jgi:uncharacterized protein (TIGR00106 family)
MKVLIDFCLVPIGVGVSLSEYIVACQKVIRDAGLTHEMHAYGTNIEGEWDEVFAVIRRCHETVHNMGAPRVTTTIKVGTRSDRDQSLDDKVQSVRSRL